jgi:hypothetical protein
VKGNSVPVTAIPNSGYSFYYWLLDGEEKTENSITVIMDANHTLEAFFVDNIPPAIGVPVQNPPKSVEPYQNVTVTVKVIDLGTGVHNVTLWFSINHGATWAPLYMIENSAISYQATISGYENHAWVTYKIIAYDNKGNQAINDNNGCYYIYYHVAAESPSPLPLFIVVALLEVVIATLLTVKLTQEDISCN